MENETFVSQYVHGHIKPSLIQDKNGLMLYSTHRQ